MKWYRNLKISLKLIIGFVVVALISAVVGIVGIVNLRSVGEADTYLYEENTVGVALAGISEVYYQRLRFYSNRMFLLEGAEREQAYNKIDEYIASTEGSLLKYEEGIRSDIDRENYEYLDSLWHRYIALINEAVGYMKNGEIGRSRAVIFGEVANVGGELQDAFQVLYDYNLNDGELTAEENTALV